MNGSKNTHLQTYGTIKKSAQSEIDLQIVCI